MCGAIYNMDDKVYITQMESAYNIIEDTNKQLDDKAMKMITLISAMLALQVNFFLPSIDNMVNGYYVYLYSESLGAYENTINHNLSLLNSKSKDLQYGFYCFIGSIILSILILVTYIV